jgi:SpoVK/Ycf46/Vps4 family AAA+-type ATPase
MVSGDDAIRALGEALRMSPENVPLRQHLADTLLGLGRPDEAEKEYRQALALQPSSQRLKLGLVHAFYQQGKASEAMVAVEDLLKAPEPPAQAYLFHARLLLQAGDVEQAGRQYRRAVDADPAAADDDLAARLGPAADEDGSPGRERVPVAREDVPAAEEVPGERSTITFRDVGGMEGLKDEIRLKILYPLSHPGLYRAYGKPTGGGILMYGPPGCGKTYLARATAGEVKAHFLAVGINEVLDMWVGQSERNLHQVFEQARGQRPCVLFFDEVDALGASRSDLRHGGARQLINQFLAELDGVQADNEGVLILAATNAPWHLDPAFRRPGRFDRILFVPPPDAPARAAILRILCRGKPVETIDYDHLSKKTEHFSGADLKAVVDAAVEQKLREAIQEGVPRPLTTRDLATAVTHVQPSTREWFSTARNYALYSNPNGLYDDVRKYLRL